MTRIHHGEPTRSEDLRAQLRLVRYLALIHDQVVFVWIPSESRESALDQTGTFFFSSYLPSFVLPTRLRAIGQDKTRRNWKMLREEEQSPRISPGGREASCAEKPRRREEGVGREGIGRRARKIAIFFFLFLSFPFFSLNYPPRSDTMGWMERIHLLSRGLSRKVRPQAGRRLITIPLLRRNCHYERDYHYHRQHHHYHRRNHRRRHRYHHRYPAATITNG